MSNVTFWIERGENIGTRREREAQGKVSMRSNLMLVFLQNSYVFSLFQRRPNCAKGDVVPWVILWS